MGDSKGSPDRWDLFEGPMRTQAEREARRRLRNLQVRQYEIEELTNRLQFRLLEAWCAFDPNRSASPEAYLRAVARREASKIIRGKRGPYGRTVPLDFDWRAEDCGDTRDPERADVIRAVSRIKEGLPDLQRQICELLATGMTRKEAARRLGVNVRTLYGHIQQLHRAFGPALGICPQPTSQSRSLSLSGAASTSPRPAPSLTAPGRLRRQRPNVA